MIQVPVPARRNNLDRLLHFPDPVENETLFGLAARYHNRVANVAAGTTCRELFGRSVFNESEVIALVRDLIELLPAGMLITPMQMITGHTLFPILQAVMPAVKRKQQASALRSSERTLAVERALCGTPTERVRMCIDCRAEDVAAHGTGIWRRHHQIPGVEVCADHGTWLLDRCLRCKTGLVPTGKFLAPPGVCRVCGEEYRIPERSLPGPTPFQTNLARFGVDWLVRPLRADRETLRNVLVTMLAQGGRCDAKGRLDQTSILRWWELGRESWFSPSGSAVDPIRLFAAFRALWAERPRPQEAFLVLAVAASTFDNPIEFRRAYDLETAGKAWTGEALPYSLRSWPPRTIRARADEWRGDPDGDAARRVEEAARQLYLVPDRRRRITKNTLRSAAGLSWNTRTGTNPQTDRALARWSESPAAWTEYRLFEAAWQLSNRARSITANELAKVAGLPRGRLTTAAAFLREFPQLAA